MKALRIVSLLVGLIYLSWRAVFTWEGTNLTLFVLLMLAEAYGIARSGVELSLMRGSHPPTSPEGDADPTPADVVVLALDEPASEIRAALLSARAVYGHGQVTLVDRDCRPELAELAQRLEVALVSGSTRADVGALLTKAAGRGFSSRVLILPGDVVVMPDVTSMSEPWFDDPEVAVVVGRVEATNAAHKTDYDGYGQGRVRDEIMAPSLDADHARPWWSGVSVIRREALEEIGGFASGRHNVTLATGVRLQVGGWRIADNPAVVARRLASGTDDRHLHRWSRDLYERLELLRREDVSWSSTRITPRMRLAYWSALIDGTRAGQRLLLISILLATLAGVGLPVAGPGLLILGAWAGQMGLRLSARWMAQRSTGFRPWIIADIRLLTTELVIGWRVLRGQRLEEELHDPAPGQSVRSLFLWSVHAALIAGVLANGLGLRRSSYGDLAMAVMLAAAAWLAIVVFQARRSARFGQMRQGFRATEELDVLNSDAGMAIVGVSPLGIHVVSKRKLEVGDRLRLAFSLPGADGSTTRLETATVVRRSSRDGKRYVGYLRFALITDEEMDRVIEYCAVVAGHREIRDSDVPLRGDLVVAELAFGTELRATDDTVEESDEDSLAGIGSPATDNP
jgi:hypothetical protein